MIKVAIYGAATSVAGELIRLLINHPDVELVSLVDNENKCKSVASVHHGLIGELDMVITDNLSIDETDVLFLCEDINSDKLKHILSDNDSNLKIIDITGVRRSDYEEYGMLYGLSEINRKPLVRGAMRAAIPSSLASLILISLYPLAANNLLCDNIYVAAEVPKAFSTDINYLKSIEFEINKQLKIIHPTFSGQVILNVEHNENLQRGMRVGMNINCELTIEDVVKIYDNLYDDHNLTFICADYVDIKEVEGTDKCLLSLTKQNENELEINSVTDCYLRGGAGEAVHIMNLLCGLLERTGLMLKTITY